MNLPCSSKGDAAFKKKEKKKGQLISELLSGVNCRTAEIISWNLLRALTSKQKDHFVTGLMLDSFEFHEQFQTENFDLLPLFVTPPARTNERKGHYISLDIKLSK